MRSRPRAELRIARQVHPGDRLVVEVSLESGARTPVDFIFLDLVGETVTPGGETPTVTTIHHARAALSGEAELEARTHAYRASFDLPADLPPSFTGSVVEARYRLVLHVSIPWWPDLRESYELRLVPRPAPRPPRRPVASTSLRANEPFVEVSLDDCSFAPGDVIGGSLAFGNLDRSRVRAVELSLLAFEEDRVAGSAPRPGARYSHASALRSPPEGREIPLRLGIPSDLVPSFATRHLGLGWAFELRLDIKGGSDIVHIVPITLGAYDSPPAPGPMRRLVGAGRWSALWAEVGRRHGLELGEGELELSGLVEGSEVAVRTAVNDGRGELRAQLRWEPLGLRLVVDASRLGGLFGVDVGDSSFARRFRVRGREPAQVRSALPPAVRRALLAFDQARLDDEGAVVRSFTPGHDQPWIGDFVGKVVALAGAMAQAAKQIAAPAGMGAYVPAWRAFAASHGGRLCVGDMGLYGTVIDGARFDLSTVFGASGKPVGAVLTLTIDPPPREPFDAKDPAALAAASPVVRAALASFATAPLLSVHFGRPVMLCGLGRLIGDPVEVGDLPSKMLALAAALRGDKTMGPYR